MNIRNWPMTARHSIAEARRNLLSLVGEAEKGKAVELTRRGEPVAMLIGRRLYERLSSKGRGFAESNRDFSSDFNLEELRLNPDEVFGNVCEKTPGRDVRL